MLGPLEVDGPDGRPLDLCGGKPAAVLTLLLLHRNAWVSTEQLVDAVWAGRDVPASAQNNLKTYVWQLRRSLPEERIKSRPGAYRVRGPELRARRPVAGHRRPQSGASRMTSVLTIISLGVPLS